MNSSSAQAHAKPGVPLVNTASSLRTADVLEVLVVAALFCIALAMRMLNLSAYSGLFDEGIRVEQLFLMEQGFRPFRDIFAAQGPLLLDLMYPLYRLYGGTLEAARLAVATYSLLGMAGVYWLVRQAGGRIGAVAALGLLILSPLYLEGSRLALAEVVALAFATPAVAAAAYYSHDGRRRWLALATFSMLISILIKPIALAAIVPLGLATLRRGKSGIRDALIIGPIALVLAALVILGVGLAGVLDQIVDYRLESRGSEGWSLAKNWRALTAAWSFEPRGLFALSLFGSGVLLLNRSWRSALIVSWAVASVALLLSYSPLHGKHAVIAIPALAAVGGAAIGIAANAARSSGRSRAIVIGVPILAALVLYLVGIPGVFAYGSQLLRVTADTDVDPALEQYSDAVSTIHALTGPDDYVITDHPYLTFLAERKVPPLLVDTAKARIRSRSLTANEAVSIASAYDPAMVVLWTDRLRPLRPFKSWVEDNFRLVKVYNRRNDLDRGIYVNNQSNLDDVRAKLSASLPSIAPVTFVGEIALKGYAVDRPSIRRGEGTTVTFHWEAIAKPTQDHKVVTYLRDAGGRQWDGQQESLSGGSIPVTEWQVGRWLFQQTFVVADSNVPSGDYLVTAGLYDSRARQLIRPDGGSGQDVLESGEIVLGRLHVD